MLMKCLFCLCLDTDIHSHLRKLTFSSISHKVDHLFLEEYWNFLQTWMQHKLLGHVLLLLPFGKASNFINEVLFSSSELHTSSFSFLNEVLFSSSELHTSSSSGIVSRCKLFVTLSSGRFTNTIFVYSPLKCTSKVLHITVCNTCVTAMMSLQ